MEAAKPMAQIPLPPPASRQRLSALSGLRVIDFSTSIAGPYGSQCLADLGAEVVKIERTESGDDSRQWGPPFLDEFSLWFLSVNRNKSSIALNLNCEDGQSLCRSLVAQADVVISNQLKTAQEKLGIDWESLRAINPQLIHASLTGFGLEGSRSLHTCYDLIAEGYSGIMDMTGEAGGDPQKIGTPAADLLAGMDLAVAVLAALIQRQRDGVGHQIDISMVDSATRFMGPRLMSYLGSGILPRRDGARESVIAIYQTFNTKTDPITLGLGNDSIWQRFWITVGKPEVGQDPLYGSNALRREHRQALVQTIQDLLLHKTQSEWLAIFAKNKIPAGPINRLDQISQDPEMQRRGMFYEVRSRGDTRIPQVGLGILIDNQASFCEKSPPLLGEDTITILKKWLNAPDSEIQMLLDNGIVKG